MRQVITKYCEESAGGISLVQDVFTCIPEGEFQAYRKNKVWQLSQINEFPNLRVIVTIIGLLLSSPLLFIGCSSFRGGTEQRLMSADDPATWIGMSASALHQAAWELYNEGRQEDAGPLFFAAEAREPQNGRFVWSAAWYSGNHSEDHDRSSRLFEQAVKLLPGEPRLLEEYAAYAALRGQVSKAVDRHKQAMVVYKSGAKISFAYSPASIRRSATNLVQAGFINEAYHFYIDALSIKPDDGESLFALGAYHAEHPTATPADPDGSQALDYLVRAYPLVQNKIKVLSRQAMVYERHARWLEAYRTRALQLALTEKNKEQMTWGGISKLITSLLFIELPGKEQLLSDYVRRVHLGKYDKNNRIWASNAHLRFLYESGKYAQAAAQARDYHEAGHVSNDSFYTRQLLVREVTLTISLPVKTIVADQPPRLHNNLFRLAVPASMPYQRVTSIESNHAFTRESLERLEYLLFDFSAGIPEKLELQFIIQQNPAAQLLALEDYSSGKAGPPVDTSWEIPQHRIYDFMDTRIQELAQNLVAGKSDFMYKVASISAWVSDYVTYNDQNSVVEIQKASDILDNPTGDCGIFAVLFATLCRAADIKTRLLFGLYLSEDSQARHTTVEVWHPGLGQWLYIEPRNLIPVGAVRHQHLVDQIYDHPYWMGSSLADLSRLPSTQKAQPDGIVTDFTSRFVIGP